MVGSVAAFAIGDVHGLVAESDMEHERGAAVRAALGQLQGNVATDVVSRRQQGLGEQRRLEVSHCLVELARLAYPTYQDVGRQDGIPLTQLNELEWIDGWIVANVWLSDYVVGIDPASGCVRWKLALEKLLDRRERRQADVLNGVAWEPDRRRLWVTGKRWPWLFGLRVDLPPPPGASAGGRCS